MSQEVFKETSKQKDNNLYCIICNKQLDTKYMEKHQCILRKNVNKIIVTNKSN